MKRKLLSTLLALCLTLCLLPGAALAASQTTVYASTPEELTNALRSNTKIVLEGKDYNVGWMDVVDLENVTIQGVAGTRLISPYVDDVVVYIRNCTNIVLDTLIIGHENATEVGCDNGVLNTGDSTVTVNNCDLFGCGMYGIDSYGGTLTMKNSKIRDCSESIMYLSKCEASFENCTFSGNGYKDPASCGIAISNAGGQKAAFSFCTFTNNKNPEFISDYAFEDGRISQHAYSLMGCTFSGNAWGAVNNTVALPTALPSPASVLINGASKSFDAYSIDNANYFKLRDLAYVLSGTEKQFEVSWDGAANAILLTSGQSYTAVGGEMTAGTGAQQSAKPTPSKILVDGKEVSLTAYNINNANYFKLRDIGELFNFGVEWNQAAQTISIDTTKGYTAG